MHVERAMKELILHKEMIFSFCCFRPADRTGEDLDIIYARLKVTYLKSEISGVTTCFLKYDWSVDSNSCVAFLLIINVYANQRVTGEQIVEKLHQTRRKLIC